MNGVNAFHINGQVIIHPAITFHVRKFRHEKIVDTLDSKVKLKIKPETQNGTKVRLKGKGFPVYKKEGQFGDLIVTYSVKIPTNLTDAQKELFRQLQSMN